MANHLIIGLGGTGGKVIRELRKRIYEEFRSIDPDGGAFLDYLYVDSSTEDLNDRTGWKVLGKKVHLGEAQKVNIHGISTSTLQNLSTRPGLKSIITDNDKCLIDQSMGPLITAGIGGQRRRLGRMLMANNLSDRNSGNNFEHKLKSAVVRLQQASGSNDITFNICAGLAGGTGSGSIVDVIAQIRKLYPYQENSHSFKIRLFVYVPEINVVYQSNDQGFYQANGYAALSELNAISVGKYLTTLPAREMYSRKTFNVCSTMWRLLRFAIFILTLTREETLLTCHKNCLSWLLTSFSRQLSLLRSLVLEKCHAWLAVRTMGQDLSTTSMAIVQEAASSSLSALLVLNILKRR